MSHLPTPLGVCAAVMPAHPCHPRAPAGPRPQAAGAAALSMGWSTDPSRPWGHLSRRRDRRRRGDSSSRHLPAPNLTTQVRFRVVASALLHSSEECCNDGPPPGAWCSLSCSQAQSRMPPLQAASGRRCVQQPLYPCVDYGQLPPGVMA